MANKEETKAAEPERPNMVAQASAAPAPEPPKAKADKVKPRAEMSRGAKLLLAKQRVEAERRVEEYQRDRDENVHYLKCPRIGTHHAAYLVGPYERGDWIEPSDWFSILKPESVAVWTRDHIPCQECYLSGETRAWSPHVHAQRTEEGSFRFKPSAKLEYVVGKCSREQLETRRAEMNKSVGQEAV